MKIKQHISFNIQNKPQLLFGLVLFALLLASLITFFRYKNVDPPNKNSTLITEWSIHEDIDRGFTLKYPSSWYLDYPKRRGDLFDFFGVATITTYDPNPFARDWTKFQLTANDLKILLLWSSDDSLTKQVLSGSIQKETVISGLTVLSASEVQLNANLSALHVVVQDNSQQGSAELLDIYYIPHEGQVFDISAKPANSIHQPTLKAILATLQFTDKN